MRLDELERRPRLDALGPAPRAELIHVLMLPDFERADRIGRLNETLTLEPVLTREQRREALALPKDFTTGSWMVSVAYERTTWNRVPCEGWC